MNDIDTVMAAIGAASARVVARPAPVPGDLRTAWRVALLLVILDKCHGNSASLEQLHVLSSVALYDESASTLTALFEGDDATGLFDRPLIRFEPALSRAVDIAVGIGLAEWTSTTRLRMTEDGRNALRAILANGELLLQEKGRLSGISGRVSQAGLDRLIDRRT